jgi:hypothetical protein
MNRIFLEFSFMTNPLGDLDFRNLFADIVSQTAESKVSTEISIEASTRLTGEFTDTFLKSRNLPPNTLISQMSKIDKSNFVDGLALHIKKAGHSNKIVGQVLSRVAKIRADKVAGFLLRAKVLLILQVARDNGLRIDKMDKNRAGAIKALMEGTVITRYKKKGPVHWPTVTNLDDCGTTTAKLKRVIERFGEPKYGPNGEIENWSPEVCKLVDDLRTARLNAEETWRMIGAEVSTEVAKVFGQRARKGTFDIDLDPLLCVASNYEHNMEELEDDDEVESAE